VFAIAEQGGQNGTGPEAIAEVLARTVDRIDTLFHAHSPITGIASNKIVCQIFFMQGSY